MELFQAAIMLLDCICTFCDGVYRMMDDEDDVNIE